MGKLKRISFLFIGFFLIQTAFPVQFVAGRQTFPSDPADITYIEYEYVQSFRHYTTNPLTGGGLIKIDMQLTDDANYSISTFYNLSVYPFICDDAVPFYGQINYTMDPQSRFIKSGTTSIGVMNPESLFSNLFLSDTFFGETYSTRFWMEDLMMTRGYILDLNFEHTGSSDVIIKDSMVNCHKISLKIDLLFPISICGLGTGIVMNVTADYHFEKTSGLLVYTNARYHEYVSGSTEKYQTHVITKTLTELNYKGQPPDGFNPFRDYEFLGDPNMVYGISGIIGIVLVTLIILKKLNNYKEKLEAEEYIKLKQSEALKKLRKNDEQDLPQN